MAQFVAGCHAPLVCRGSCCQAVAAHVPLHVPHFTCRCAPPPHAAQVYSFSSMPDIARNVSLRGGGGGLWSALIQVGQQLTLLPPAGGLHRELRFTIAEQVSHLAAVPGVVPTSGESSDVTRDLPRSVCPPVSPPVLALCPPLKLAIRNRELALGHEARQALIHKKLRCEQYGLRCAGRAGTLTWCMAARPQGRSCGRV